MKTLKLSPFALRLALLAGLSFTLGMLVGCGDVTATVVPPAPSPDSRWGSDAFVSGGDSDVASTDGGSVDSVDQRGGVGGTGGTNPSDVTLAPPPDSDAGAPPPPRPHCQGAAADYRVTVCKPACGTCGKLGEASTYIAGCWTADDFHCVDNCGDCR